MYILKAESSNFLTTGTYCENTVTWILILQYIDIFFLWFFFSFEYQWKSYFSVDERKKITQKKSDYGSNNVKSNLDR
jgi:hypothetical protein